MSLMCYNININNNRRQIPDETALDSKETQKDCIDTHSLSKFMRFNFNKTDAI